jgi:putative heme transporter
MRRRILALAVTAIAVYVVAPAVIDVLGGWRNLGEVAPGWWVAVLVSQVAGWACMWAVQRLALHTKPWLPVATSQLASGAIGRVVPGGAAAAAALQYRMLWQAGLERATVATGLAAGSVLLLAALASLPLLAVPAFVAGRKIPDGLLNAGILALVLFVFLFALGALLVVSDRVVRWVGRTTTQILRRVRPRRPAPEGLPDRFSEQRSLVLLTLGRHWPGAVAAAEGRWLFDFLTLLAALQAVDARPRLTLALLAYCAAQLLAQVPITPGGLGIVEAGMTGTLALAGVPAAAAAVAVLAYRMASYWLPLPVGGAAWFLHRRRYGPTAEDEDVADPAGAPA